MLWPNSTNFPNSPRNFHTISVWLQFLINDVFEEHLF